MRRTLTDVVKSYAVSATTLLIYMKFATIGGHWQVKTAKHILRSCLVFLVLCTRFFQHFFNNETIFSLALSGEKQFVSL